MSISINMSLTQGHGLGKNIIACSEKIDEKNAMILDEAEDALVVVASSLWAESNDNTLGGVWLDDTLSHGE